MYCSTVLSRKNTSDFRLQILLSLFATVFAIIATIFRGVEHIGISDGHNYVDQAVQMLNGLNYMYQNPDLFQHGLGFSWSISLSFLISQSNSLLLFKLFLAVGHGLSSLLLAKIGSHLGLRRKYWVATTLLFILDPFILLAATDIQTESITTLIVIFWGYLYILPKEMNKNRNLMVFLFVLSGSYSTLMRPNSILPFLMVAAILLFKWGKEGLHKFVLVSSISIFLGIIGLFEIFITKMYRGFVFLSPVGGGNAEFMCKPDFIPQYLGYASSKQNSQINSLINTSQSSNLLLQNPGLSISQINSELTSAGIATCLNNPIQSLWVITLKVFALWRPFTVYGAYGSSILILTLAFWLPLTVSAIWYLQKKGHPKIAADLRIFFIVMSAGFAISLLLTPTQIRHRVAFAEPFYWLFAIFFVQSLRRPKTKDLSHV